MHSKSKLALWISLQFIVKSHHYALRLCFRKSGVGCFGRTKHKDRGLCTNPFPASLFLTFHLRIVIACLSSARDGTLCFLCAGAALRDAVLPHLETLSPRLKDGAKLLIPFCNEIQTQAACVDFTTPINSVAEWCRSCLWWQALTLNMLYWRACWGLRCYFEYVIVVRVMQVCALPVHETQLYAKAEGLVIFGFVFPESRIYESSSPDSLFDNAKSFLQFPVSVCAPSSISASTEWSSWWCPYKKINNSNLNLLFILCKLRILKEIPSICH